MIDLDSPAGPRRGDVPRRCHDASERRFAGVDVEAETSVGDPTVALGSGSLIDNETSIRDREFASDASDASRWHTRRSHVLAHGGNRNSVWESYGSDINRREKAGRHRKFFYWIGSLEI